MNPISKVCPYCGSEGKLIFDQGRDYYVAKGKSADFEVRSCVRCLVGYSLPAMTQEELSSYYPTDYEPYHPKKAFSAWLQKVKYSEDLNLIGRFIKQEKGSFFEIGPGRGEFLFEARKRGFDVMGLEPSATGIQSARELYNIQLEAGYDSDLRFKQRHQVIVARHVLEHVNHPLEFLKKVKRDGLAENGVLFLKFPQIDSWEARFFGKFWRGYDLPRHRTHFTRRGIQKMLMEAGFSEDKIKIYPEVVPVDLFASLDFYYCYGPRKIYKAVAGVMCRLPFMLKMILGQIIGLVFSVFGAGRMIVVAQNI